MHERKGNGAAGAFELFCGVAAGESIVDAAPTCRVWIDGRKVTTVYETAVCHQRYWTAEPTLSTTPVAIASCEFPCERL